MQATLSFTKQKLLNPLKIFTQKNVNDARAFIKCCERVLSWIPAETIQFEDRKDVHTSFLFLNKNFVQAFVWSEKCPQSRETSLFRYFRMRLFISYCLQKKNFHVKYHESKVSNRDAMMQYNLKQIGFCELNLWFKAHKLG